MDSSSRTWRETCEILLRKISNDSLQMERRPSPELLHIHGQHDDLLGLGDPHSIVFQASTYGGLPSFSVSDTFDNRCIELAVRIRTAGQKKKTGKHDPIWDTSELQKRAPKEHGPFPR